MSNEPDYDTYRRYLRQIVEDTDLIIKSIKDDIDKDIKHEQGYME